MGFTNYAGDGSYPATVPLPDDSVTWDSADLNPTPEALADRTSALRNDVNGGLIALPALNVSSEFLVAGSAHSCVAWDDGLERYLLGLYNGSNLETFYSYGSGDDSAGFIQFGGTISTPDVVWVSGIITSALSPGVVYWCCVGDAGGTISPYKCDLSGSATWTVDPIAPRIAKNGRFGKLGDYLHLAAGGTDAAHSGIYWTKDDGSLWQPLLSTACGTVADWIVCADPTIPLIVFIPRQAGAGSGQTYITSSSTNHLIAPVFNAHPFGGTIVGASDTPVGLGTGLLTDGVTRTFVLAVNKGSDSYIYTSPDAINWTQVKKLTGISLADLKCVGRLWIASTADDSNKESRILFSVDGGSTWRYSPAWFTNNGTATATAGYIGTTFAVAPNGFLASNNKFARVSRWAGLPAVTL